MSKKVLNVELKVLPGGDRPKPPKDYVNDVFGTSGYIAKQIDGYRLRSGQLKLARSVDRAIAGGHHLIGEGPTGTGKSLAYLVPAVFHAVYHGKRVVVVTGNKNLQRQIYSKDLADLSAAVPWAFTYAIRKGISSYLCMREFHAGQWRELIGRGLEIHEEELVEQTVEWANSTGTGDYEDSPGLHRKLWRAFSTVSDECTRKSCKQFPICHVKAAKERAEKADITVTNYHLFFLHLKLGKSSKIFPEFDVVVLDEAHRAANTAREFLGFEVGYMGLAQRVRNMDMVDVRKFKSRGKLLKTRFMHALPKLWHDIVILSRIKRAVLKPGVLPSELIEKLLEDIGQFWSELAEAQAEGPAYLGLDESACVAQAEKCTERALQLGELRTCSDDKKVYFVEGGGDGDDARYRLKAKQIDVTSFLRYRLFENFPTVIQTSATLSVTGSRNDKSSFEYQKREMGMLGAVDGKPLDIDEIVVESPFDWPSQAMLVIPGSMPPYRYDSQDYDRTMCEHFEQIVNTVRGRTMGLFTSFRALKLVKSHLDANTRWTIFSQGQGTNRELAEKFQADVNSVLLGAESFTEGVSIEGDACTCVVIDKLPFIHKDDPVLHGIEKDLKRRGSRENSFQIYQKPQAIIAFKQRVGRLIRTVSDVGVVVVLDSRLGSNGKRYRHEFLRSVPPMKIATSIEDIAPFLRKKGAL